MESDGRVLDIERCREIVKEIINFGVTQDQILMIMQLLSYELEDHEKMQILSTQLRDFLREKKFLFIDTMEENKDQ